MRNFGKRLGVLKCTEYFLSGSLRENRGLLGERYLTHIRHPIERKESGKEYLLYMSLENWKKEKRSFRDIDLGRHIIKEIQDN